MSLRQASGVSDFCARLVPAAETFVSAYSAGDASAREQFPLVRAHYERIEPVASTLGDLDPPIDYREVDAVAEGLDWTGFHRIERDLWMPAQDSLNADQVTPTWQDWAPSSPSKCDAIGTWLVVDIQSLYDYVHSADFQSALDDQGIAAISNGAISLLDEVATKDRPRGPQRAVRVGQAQPRGPHQCAGRASIAVDGHHSDVTLPSPSGTVASAP